MINQTMTFYDWIQNWRKAEDDANEMLMRDEVKFCYDELIGTYLVSNPNGSPIWRLIADYFKTRYVYAPHFYRWYMLAYERNKNRFYELIRIEPGYSHFDWLVTEYQELQQKVAGTGTIGVNGTGQTIINGNNTTNVINGGNTQTTGGGSDTSDNYADTVTLSKTNPMSITYASGITGHTNTGSNVENINSPTSGTLSWTNPSTQGEGFAKTSNKNINTNNSTTTNNLTTNTTANNTQTNDIQTTQETTRDTTDLTQMQRTGRSGQLSQLLSEAQGWIQKSSAWEWLRHELESIFIGVYDLDDYELLSDSEIEYPKYIKNFEWR